MWPYNDDEAGWLNSSLVKRPRAEPPTRNPVNDNDPARRVPPRGSARNTQRET